MTNPFLRTFGHPLMFGSFRTWLHLAYHNGVDLQYLPKALTVSLVSALTSPLRMTESLLYRSQVEKTAIEHPPIFIIGHWRTGTTYLHQLMSLDERFGYVTLYQTLAPEIFFLGQYTIKPFISLMAPKTRPGDNMEIPLDGPQEEEFGLVNMSPHAFYHHWSFPQNQRDYFRKYVLMDDISTEEQEKFQQVYRYVLQAATKYAGGKRLVIKNPSNSGRIPLLLKMFPGAKFIHIYRNPYVTYKSTVKYYKEAHQLSKLQRVSDAQLSDDILYMYSSLMKRLIEDIALIPPQDFAEVRYEDLADDGLGQMQTIYDNLGLGGFDAVKGKIQTEISQRASYQTNTFNFDADTIQKVNAHWGFAVERWNYAIPE